MLRKKIIAVVSIVFLLISPSLLHSQGKSFTLFDVIPASDHTVLIQWRMKPEMDSLPFEVERSMDKRTWKRIAALAAHSSHQYASTDTQPGEGLVYYRVRQVGSKSRFLYTGVNWVQFSEKGKLYIWPNLANNVLHVKTPYVNGSMDIIDAGGKQILKITITNFITDVPTDRLSKGFYFLYVRHANETLVEKFVKE
jgi:hypothetical protein